MASPASFNEIKSGIFSALVELTRTAGQIANDDLAFHRSSNPSIVPLLEQQSARLLHVARRLTRSATTRSEVNAPQIADADSVEENWKEIVDVFDSLLEKADACLDEYTGVIRRLSPEQEEKIKKTADPIGKQRPGKAYRTQSIVKPQLLFEQVPTNDDVTPFKPLLRTKPHAITPLKQSLTPVQSEDGSTWYGHPYGAEINALRYPAATFRPSEAIPYLPYESTTATLVDTPQAVALMLQDLKLAKEIAVDLEHHDEHSYIGLVSLMQISTRDKDWVIDTLKPWRQELQVLNEVFADPKIIKRFADFDAAKQYQMADWRIRPLPEEMFNYARSDTHFLLYIYDKMRNELIEGSGSSEPQGDLIEDVMNKSKEESLQRYERPKYDAQSGLGAMGWWQMLYRTPALFNREQFAVFRAVHQWRDTLARQEDESVHTVMPKHVLFNIAREIPMNMPSLLGCSHPVSRVFQKRKRDLLDVIKEAKSTGAAGPELKSFISTAHSGSTGRSQEAEPNVNATIKPGGADHALHRYRQNTSVARAEVSRFWGSTVLEDVSSPISKTQWNDDTLRLALPLPQLTAEVFEDQTAVRKAAASVPPVDSGAQAEHQYVKDGKRKEDDVFVVKQIGGSRKRKASHLDDPRELVCRDKDGEVPNGSPTNLNSEQQESFSAKPHRTKEEKRQRRLERKQQEALGSAKRELHEESEPFDYESAPSVLHAKSNMNGKVEAVTPYAKATDAPKGMQKTQKEIPGRSFTFKG
ncbi:exosome complex exonuclease RRP6, partial [Lecanoromycetidae sp. Uapishka_2]